MKKINLEEIKRKYDKMELEGFDVNENALYCPNADEWYFKAYIENNYGDFRIVPGLKNSKKIATVEFGGTGSVLFDADCDWTEGDSELSTIKIEACRFDVMHSICQYDLEDSFFVESMKEGRDGWKQDTEKAFFKHYWGVLALKVAEDIQKVIWNGQAENGFECTGLLERIEDSSAFEIGATAAVITVGNVEGLFESALLALPSSVSRNKSEVCYYVSPATYNKIAIAASKNNTTNYTTKELEMFYLNHAVKIQGGMPDNKIVLTRKSNLIVGVDAIGDDKNLKIRDLDVINIPKIRTRVSGVIATQIANPSEIVYVTTL